MKTVFLYGSHFGKTEINIVFNSRDHAFENKLGNTENGDLLKRYALKKWVG